MWDNWKQTGNERDKTRNITPVGIELDPDTGVEPPQTLKKNKLNRFQVVNRHNHISLDLLV